MVTEKGFHHVDEMFLMFPGFEPVVHERELPLMRPTELKREHQHC